MKNKWIPQEQEVYFYVDTFGRVSSSQYDSSNCDDKELLKLGNCYSTKTLAIAAMRRINRIHKENYITDVLYLRRVKHGDVIKGRK